MKELEWSCRETVPLIFVYYHSERGGSCKTQCLLRITKTAPPLEEYGAEPAVL